MAVIKRTCQHVVIRGCFGRGRPCGNKAKIKHDGKHYCGVHDPIKKKERLTKQVAKYEAEMKTKIVNYKKIKLYPKLVEVLKACYHESPDNQEWYTKITKLLNEVEEVDNV